MRSATLNALAVLLGLAAQATALPSTLAQAAEPLRVEAQVRPGPYFAGQTIELRVGVIAGGERPAVLTPRIAGATVTTAGTEFKPLSTSAIGSLVAERNLYLFLFRIIPRQGGKALVVPPVSARLGDRSGASKPIRLNIRSVPTASRPAEFLGGVGPFAVEASANPATVRLGQSFEYRITITGPGARASVEAPALERFGQVPLNLRITPLSPEAVDDPPSRVFRYQIRPSRTGSATLPPVTVAAFDPKTERFVTKATAGVPVRVADVPRFDPSSLNYVAPPDRDRAVRARAARWGFGIAGLLLAIAGGLLLLVRWRRARRGRAWRSRRLTARVIRDLNAAQNDADAARIATNGLAAYLLIVADRPTGALTPAEAGDWTERVAENPALSQRAERLIAQCDRSQYATDGVSTPDLVGEAVRFFESLAAREEGQAAGAGKDQQQASD
jgi:hypothetical protein